MAEKPMMHVPLTRVEVREMGNLPEHMREIARFAENVLPRAAEDLARMRTETVSRDRAWARLVSVLLRALTGVDVIDESVASDRTAAETRLRDIGVPLDALLAEASKAE
jgi:hypothetical protein